MDRGRCHRSAAGFCGFERDGADGAERKSVFGPGVCVSRQTRRSDQVVVVGWRRALSFREEAGTWKIYLAASNEWNGFADASAVVDAAGGDRLAASGANDRSADCGVSILSFVLQEFHRRFIFAVRFSLARERVSGILRAQ